MSISLLYHDVVRGANFASSGFSGADADIYKLEESAFASHLEAIRMCGIDVRPGLFTFDDGGASALRAADLLEGYNWRGCFFISTDYIGRPGFLSDSGIRDLQRRGHTIGSHSCSHPPRMAALGSADLIREWRDSLSVLAGITGERCRTASVPGGYYSRRVAEAADQCGVEELYTSEPVASVQRIGRTLVRGRYSVQRGTGASKAASLARGDLAPRLRQYAYWNAKKMVKAAGGRYWLTFRKYILARTSPHAAGKND